MITGKELFWKPVGWVGWIRIEPGQHFLATNEPKAILFTRVTWLYLKKTGYKEYKRIAEVKIKIWVDDWRCVYGPDNHPCTRCDKLEDCIYSQKIEE